MVEKLLKIWKKHESVFVYLIFGVLTTLVNYIAYFLCYNLMQMSGVVSNAISWVVAVLFAFFTNKPFVFKSNDWSLPVTMQEFVRFVGCRVGSGLLETGIIFLTVDCMHWNGHVIKLACSVMVVIINYVASRFLVFVKAKKKA